MVTARKPVIAATSHAERLLDLFRREIDYRYGGELLEALIALPHMRPATAKKIWARLDRPRCAESVVVKMADEAIREMVDRGHATEVEAWLEREIASRRDGQFRYAWSQLLARLGEPTSEPRVQKVATILETARRVDATFEPPAEEARDEGEMGSTQLMLREVIAAADQAELVKMLEAVLFVASDRVVDAVEPTRQSEERMLAEYHADRARGAA